MGFKCCVPGCSSGYASDNSTDVSMHKFPNDDVRKQQWLRCINRADFIPTNNSRVCSKHFIENDFKIQRQDSNVTRKRSNTGTPMTLRSLKEYAKPSIFPNQPSYLTSRIFHRAATSHADNRVSKQNAATLDQIDQMEKLDSVSTLSDLREKANFQSTFPGSFFLRPPKLKPSVNLYQSMRTHHHQGCLHLSE